MKLGRRRHYQCESSSRCFQLHQRIVCSTNIFSATCRWWRSPTSSLLQTLPWQVRIRTYRVFHWSNRIYRVLIIQPICRLCVHCGGHNNREIHHHQADYKGCSNYSFMRSCCLRRRIVRSAIVNGTTRLGPTGSCNIKGFLLMTLGEGLKKVEIPTN